MCSFSFKAASCIYEEVQRLPFFHLEDVFITGFAAQNCKVPRIHSDRFVIKPTKIEDIYITDVLIHYVNSRAKNKIFKVSIAV